MISDRKLEKSLNDIRFRNEVARLSELKLGLDKPENIALLKQHKNYASDIVSGIIRLSQSQPRLDTYENILLLAEYEKYSLDIAFGILCFSAVYPRLDTQYNFNLLFIYSEFLQSTLNEIQEARDANLLNQTSLDNIIDNNRKKREREKIVTDTLTPFGIGFFSQKSTIPRILTPPAEIICSYLHS